MYLFYSKNRAMKVAYFIIFIFEMNAKKIKLEFLSTKIVFKLFLVSTAKKYKL